MDLISYEQIAFSLKEAIDLSVDYQELIEQIEREQNLPPPPNICLRYEDGPKLLWDLMDDRFICFEAQRLNREKENMSPTDYEFNKWNIRRAACVVMKKKLNEVYELIRFFEAELENQIENPNFYENASESGSVDIDSDSQDFYYDSETGYYTDAEEDP